MDISRVTPMMQQYLRTKEEYPDCILMYRLGDFYEMFFDDAVTASRELEIALTGKDCGLDERAPMCGVPHHSATVYISRLVGKGYKVAVCEQMEDPKEAKGIVKREVVRVITPGTVIEETMLDDKKNNYLAVIYSGGGVTGLAFSDISTGELYTTQVIDTNAVIDELARYEPAEIIINEDADGIFSKKLTARFEAVPAIADDDLFEYESRNEKILSQFHKRSLKELSLDGKNAAAAAVGGMLMYLEQTQKSSVPYISELSFYETAQYMSIDAASRRNLEITETMRDKTKRGSLLGVLDKTKTSMGARKLKQWLEKPLVNPVHINNRLYSVRELNENIMLRDDIAAALSGIYDMARIVSRVALKTVTPRDLVSLRLSLAKLPELDMLLTKTTSPVLQELSRGFDIMSDLRELLEYAITDDPPVSVKDGGVIRKGFHEEIDALRNAITNGKQWIAEVEAEEKQTTGIKNLKISYNKVFGYYIEVTKSNLKDVPETYIRKQTLANCERYITPKLKEIENTILGASEKITNLEAHVFEDVRSRVAQETERLKNVCDAVASVDALYSLAEAAHKNNYTMPEVAHDGSVQIKDGRHPVVEKMLKSAMFIPNDTMLNTDTDRMLIITGPNMAGKSTYMRQVALITLMAQIGSFVPASYAKISPVDKIFTRVGASDDIASGQSTFMLEMTEVANILKNATKNSLIILDEIGRGTSTYDGLSIAWSVVEYVQSKKRLGAKTLFATHYHELTDLEDKLDGVKNYRIAVKKRGDDITFLRKIVRGGADDSYGIEVAALAGVPKEVISRAKEILKDIDDGQIRRERFDSDTPETDSQLGFEDMAAVEIVEKLKVMDVTTLTPIEALNTLYKLVNEAKGM
jgi:DNA mismatch repair protein MutS